MSCTELVLMNCAVSLVDHWRFQPDQFRSTKEQKLWDAVDDMQGRKTRPKHEPDPLRIVGSAGSYCQ